MNRFVNSVAGRLSLRSPQRQSLKVLARLCEILPLVKNPPSREDAKESIRKEFPQVTDFERDFRPSASPWPPASARPGSWGAFVSYLYLAHGVRNFFVLPPNLTIYNKLIADFTRTTPKYVFQGIQDFTLNQPVIIAGDNDVSQARTQFDQPDDGEVNSFNISKINSEVRGQVAPHQAALRVHRGNLLRLPGKLDDLVLLTDESHRYRVSDGVRAINELKPILGLELTATPFVETTKGAIPFKNVVVDYPLARAMEDGFVKSRPSSPGRIPTRPACRAKTSSG